MPTPHRILVLTPEAFSSSATATTAPASRPRPAPPQPRHSTATTVCLLLMHTDPLLYRLFQERPALAFALAGLTVPAAAAYRWQAIEVKQTAFRLDRAWLMTTSTPQLG